MPIMTLSCDRCNRYFEARCSNGKWKGEVIHYNYYVAFNEEGEETWCAKYFKPGEETLCAKCVRDQPEYLERYPWMKGFYN